MRTVAIHAPPPSLDTLNTDIDTIRFGSLRARLAAEVGGLETVAQSPDTVHVRAAAGVNAMASDGGQALVIGGEHQLGIVQLSQIGAEERRAKLRIINRVGEVDA